MEISDAAVLAGISAAFIVLKNVRKKRKKYGLSIWVKNYIKSRNSRLITDLEFNEDVLFKNFTRMSKRNIYTILGIVESMFTKQNTRFRESVPAEMKLAITLRYLATGDSFISLMYLFKVTKQFISSMLPGVLKAIVEGLQDYVKVSFLLLYFFNITIFLHSSNIHEGKICITVLCV
jgi:hypothetical protein